MNVLFIEDEAELREETVEVLVRLGHKVVAVDKAEEALVELGRAKFDLIITDNDTKSRITGRELVQQIRRDIFYQEIKDIPIIIQSGDAIEEQAKDLKAVFLPKPWRRRQLKEAMDAAVLQQTSSLFRI